MRSNIKSHQLLNHIGNELKLLWWQMDIVEPTHATLDNRTAMLPKQLCSSLYLDRMLETMPDESKFFSVAELHAFEKANMGEDRIRPIFTNGQGNAS